MRTAILVDNSCSWRAKRVDRPRQIVSSSTILAAAVIWSIPINRPPYATTMRLMGVLVNGKFQSIAKSTASDDPALFVDDRELHRRIAPHIGHDAFRTAIKALEAKNFPRPAFSRALFPSRENLF